MEKDKKDQISTALLNAGSLRQTINIIADIYPQPAIVSLQFRIAAEIDDGLFAEKKEEFIKKLLRCIEDLSDTHLDDQQQTARSLQLVFLELILRMFSHKIDLVDSLRGFLNQGDPAEDVLVSLLSSLSMIPQYVQAVNLLKQSDIRITANMAGTLFGFIQRFRKADGLAMQNYARIVTNHETDCLSQGDFLYGDNDAARDSWSRRRVGFNKDISDGILSRSLDKKITDIQRHPKAYRKCMQILRNNLTSGLEPKLNTQANSYIDMQECHFVGCVARAEIDLFEILSVMSCCLIIRRDMNANPFVGADNSMPRFTTAFIKYIIHLAQSDTPSHARMTSLSILRTLRYRLSQPPIIIKGKYFKVYYFTDMLTKERRRYDNNIKYFFNDTEATLLASFDFKKAFDSSSVE